MRPNPTKSSGWLLALCAAAAACGQGPTDAGRTSRVVLDFGAVLGGDFISVLDTAYLTITAGGVDRTLSQRFGTGDSETTFDVSVKPGDVTFSFEAVSTNGTLLYQGQTATTIAGDGFAVAITPQAVNPVLVVSPRKASYVQFDAQGFRSFTATLQVRNAGLDSLKWRVDSLVTLPQGVSMFCTVNDNDCLRDITFAAATNAVAQMGFSMPSSVSFQPLATLRFISNVGNITTTP